MSDARPSLYDLLMAIKPDSLTSNAWASRAGVSRSFFTDVRNGTVPKTSTLEKVVKEAGLTLAQFYDLDGARAVAPITESRPAPELPFRGRGEPMDVPLVGTAQGSDLEILEDGSVRFIERMDLSIEAPVDYVRRPPALANRRDVYMITVIGNSVAPRYADGDPAYIDPKRQPQRGDYVVVQLRGEDDGPRIALFKEFVRRTSTYIELAQSQPETSFQVPLQDVLAIHRVIPWKEIVFF